MRTGRDGRTINTANIGRGKKGKPPAAPEKVLDKLGHVVPARLEDVFADTALREQAERVRGWLGALECASVEREIARRQGSYPYVPAVAVREHLDLAHHTLRAAAELIEQNLLMSEGVVSLPLPFPPRGGKLGHTS
jgi:hypothetical protein